MCEAAVNRRDKTKLFVPVIPKSVRLEMAKMANTHRNFERSAQNNK